MFPPDLPLDALSAAPKPPPVACAADAFGPWGNGQGGTALPTGSWVSSDSLCFFPQCLASATEGVRLAARIVDTPCNEMNTDTFLEVRVPRESCWGGTRVGEAFVDPKEVRGYPGLEEDSASSLCTLPGTAWGC